SLLITMIFYVHAEDGIRCFHVTGVQTCALPICRPPRALLALCSSVAPSATGRTRSSAAHASPTLALDPLLELLAAHERRPRAAEIGRASRRGGVWLVGGDGIGSYSAVTACVLLV